MQQTPTHPGDMLEASWKVYFFPGKDGGKEERASHKQNQGLAAETERDVTQAGKHLGSSIRSK